MALLAVAASLSLGCALVPPHKSAAQPQVTAPPESLGLDPFYKKHVNAQGLPIVSSEKVADAALLKARELMNKMLTNRPDIREALSKARVRFIIIGATEQTTDIPEYSHMKPKEFWNKRSRGFGGRNVSCGEENLLCYPVDRYDDENILIHEFAHTIHGIGLRRIDKDFDKRLRQLYKKALAKGLWKGTYAASNRSEYWAEAVQSYFDSNRQNNYNHNHVNTRQELEAYDPELAQLVAETFRLTDKTDWRYKPVAKQPQVTSPPPALKCDPFYKKYVRARGLPILSSEKVSDEALLEANHLIRQMFAYRHDILKAMIEAGLRFVVIGVNEKLADIPEYKDPQNEEHRDKLIRVLRCTPKRLIISCGQENLLNHPADRYAGESILIREFANALHVITGHRPVDKEFEKKPKQQYELGVKRIDKEFDDRLRQLYERAMEKGLWNDTNAAKSREEYWSEGVQSWFDANRRNDDGHNNINTRVQLEAYDPDLAKLIAEVFRHADRVDWRYQRPSNRKDPIRR
jgi:alpha-glucosidase